MNRLLVSQMGMRFLYYTCLVWLVVALQAKDKRPNIENRPGALWEIEGTFPGMEHYEALFRQRYGVKVDYTEPD